MTKFRIYDPAVGRFWQADPKADQDGQESWTPYHYAFDNPILYNDPYGDCPTCFTGLISLYAGLKAKYSFIASKAHAPAQRLISGTSGDIPNNINADSRTRTISKVTGTSSDINQVAETGKELAREAAKDGGEIMDQTGEVVSDAGLVAAPFTEGASLVLVPVGETMSAVGKGAKAYVNYLEGNYSEVATETGKLAFGLVTNRLTEEAIQQSKRVGNIANSSEEVSQETVMGAIGSAWNKVLNYFTDDE